LAGWVGWRVADSGAPSRTQSAANVVWSTNSISASKSARALLFEGRGLLFGVAADSVTEVIDSQVINEVPGSPAWFKGVCVYRTNPVPLIDVARFFEPNSSELVFNRAIAVRTASSTYLLAAEKILNLCKLPAEDFHWQGSDKQSSQELVELHGTPDYAKHRAIKKACRYDNRLLALIDLPELLRSTKLLRECAVS